MLNDYEIRNELGYMVMDNVGSNDTLITTIDTSLNDKEVSYNAIQRRLRCNDHVINLAVQVFLFEKRVNGSEYLGNKADSSSDIQLNQWRRLKPLGKLHNIYGLQNRSGGLMHAVITVPGGILHMRYLIDQSRVLNQLP